MSGHVYNCVAPNVVEPGSADPLGEAAGGTPVFLFLSNRQADLADVIWGVGVAGEIIFDVVVEDAFVVGGWEPLFVDAVPHVADGLAGWTYAFENGPGVLGDVKKLKAFGNLSAEGAFYIACTAADSVFENIAWGGLSVGSGTLCADSKIARDFFCGFF